MGHGMGVVDALFSKLISNVDSRPVLQATFVQKYRALKFHPNTVAQTENILLVSHLK